MTTAKKWLEDLGFDQATGRILLRWYENEENGYQDRRHWEKDDTQRTAFVSIDHPRMVQELDTGFGGCEAPMFVAEDAKYLYIVGTYDGSSWLEKIAKDLSAYLDPKLDIPTIGGG